MGDKPRVAMYARVSKGRDQTPENQLLRLHRWRDVQDDIVVVGEFVDEISSRDSRPKKEEVKRLARSGEVNTIVFVRLDRWGRSISELVLEMEEFRKRGIALISLEEGLNFDTAAGQLYANMLAAFANFERELIRERTLAGLARARAQGIRLGRPPNKSKGFWKCPSCGGKGCKRCNFTGRQHPTEDRLRKAGISAGTVSAQKSAGSTEAP